MSMKVFSLDPMCDARWQRLVDRHPRSSIFHTQGWLGALQRTYGYRPVAYTLAQESEELGNGLVFCLIDSRLTGRRLVSLPFSDHCEPLVNTQEEWERLSSSLVEMAALQACKYVEIRPMHGIGLVSRGNTLARSQSFYLHTLDIGPKLEDIYVTFHRKAVQQLIKRAEREDLSVEEGRSPELVRHFYRLLIRTRRRHSFPPQPLQWFKNLVECLGSQTSVRVAFSNGEPIASIFTLSFKDHVYYKYGCTDERFHSLGGLQLLLWRAIRAEKEAGAKVLDMGRSDIDQSGLVRFKERWGAIRSVLEYYRYPAPRHQHSRPKWAEQALSYAVSCLPDSVLTKVGGILYPHMG